MDRGLDLLGAALDKRAQRNPRRSAPIASIATCSEEAMTTCSPALALGDHPMNEARALLLEASCRFVSAVLAHYLPTAAGPLTPDLFYVS